MKPVLLGAGLLIGLAAGAAAGGWWVLGGIVLAALLTALPVWFGRPAPPGLRAALAVACSALVALVFATYRGGEHAAVVAVLVLAAATAVVAFGWVPPAAFRRVVTGSLLIVAAGFVAVCVAIAPPEGREGWFTGDAGGGFALTPVPSLPGVAGALPAAGVLLALFTVLDGSASSVSRGRILVRLGSGTTVAVAVAAAALYQIGPTRLGLSPTSLRDVLVTAGAAELTGVLDLVVVLATVPALITVLAIARDELAWAEPPPWPRVGWPRIAWPRGAWRGQTAARSILAGAVASLLAAALAPAAALMLASSLGLMALVTGCLRPATGRQAKA